MPNMAQHVSTALAAVVVMSSLASACPPAGVYTQQDFGLSSELKPRGSIYNMKNSTWDQGVVPYILADLPHELMETIRAAMRDWEQGTCVRFVRKATTSTKWVNFRSAYSGCFTEFTGAPVEGDLTVNLDVPNALRNFAAGGLDRGCAEVGTVEHELGHVLGLIHEQQRPDRDQFVEIVWDHVKAEFTRQFAIIEGADTSVPFDLGSVMMSPDHGFSKDCGTFLGDHDCHVTIQSKVANQEVLPSLRPTAADKASINKQYGCEALFTTDVSDVYDAKMAVNTEQSTYTFRLDYWTEVFMRDNGYPIVGVRQFCTGRKIGGYEHDSNNWAFTALTGSNNNAVYNVLVNRCKKRYSREPAGYEIALCKTGSEDSCDVRCGMRNIRPINPGTGEEVGTKAVELEDKALWICHPH